MIDRSVIEELKMRNNIEDVISSYVHLTRAGQNMKGLCPFHSERTPSFTVFPKEDNFYCFGCGAGGDVVTFIMKAENLSYPDALQYLAQRSGISLPESSYKQGEQGMDRSEIMRMNRHAARFFYERLTDPATPQGLEYLTKKRGFSLPLIRHFGMGFAPENGYGLKEYLKRKGYTEEQMEIGYLVKKSADGKRYYDVFRGRVMVPILDAGGNIIAFGGRLMGDGQPKYLNSGETPAFRKSKTLFALNFAKDLCQERMILCEGYMDVIALHGAGFGNAVATLGTAITPEHARMMKRYTKSVVICYDADAAGQNAADKAFRMLSEVGLDTRILKVEGAKDPDEYIKRSGAEAFTRLLEGSKTRFEFKFGQILDKYDLSIMENRIKAAEETTELILQFPSKVEQEMYIVAAAKKLNVTSDSLKNEVERRQRRQERKNAAARSTEILRKAEGYSDRINPQTIGNVAAARAEESLLGLMMLREEIAEKAVREGTVEEGDFVTDFNKRVFTGLKTLVLNGQTADPYLMAEDFTADEMGRIVRMRLDRLELADNGYGVFLQCLEKLRSHKKRRNTTEDIEEILRKKREKNGQ